MSHTHEYRPLSWTVEHDSDDNSAFLAASTVYSHDGAGFYFQIRPRLVGDSVRWSVLGSDEELIGEPTEEVRRGFGGPLEAKAWCEGENRVAFEAEAQGR